MYRTLIAALILGFFHCEPAAAQMPRGGDYVAIDATMNRVLVITPSGAVTTLHQGLPLQQASGIAVTATGQVLVADFVGTLFRIDAPGQVTPIAQGLSGPIRVAIDRNGDYLVTELLAARVARITPQGNMSSVFSGPPLLRPFGICVDPSNGDILVACDSPRSLYRVNSSGASLVHSGSPFQLTSGVAMFANGDYAVIDGIVDGLFRVPRAGGTPTLVQSVPVLGNPDAVVANFDGAVAISESGSPNGNRIVVARPEGTIAVIASGAPFGNLEGLARTPHLQGAVVGTPGTTLPLTLDVPGQALNPYLLLFSTTLYPGFALPMGETPIVPDATFLSFVGFNNSVFQNFVGTLDAADRAQPTIAIPRVIVPRGLTLHFQAVTLDFSQPTSLGAFSNLHSIRF